MNAFVHPTITCQSGDKPSEQGDDDERAECPPRAPLAPVWGDGDRDRTSPRGPVARVGALVAGQGANRANQGVTDPSQQCREHDGGVGTEGEEEQDRGRDQQ
jgi:hypothetical protein